MKKPLFILMCIVAAALFVGCENLSWTDFFDSNNNTQNTQSTTRNIDVELRSSVESSVSRTAVAQGDELAMWFRSSDIEFWSTELAGGYTELVSDLYSSESDEADKISVSINLPDVYETFKFLPGLDHEVQDASASFASTVYDIIRIDIGSGGFSFEHNENHVSVRNTITGESDGINGNSIFLISSTMLDAPYYVPRTVFYNTKEELIASGRSEWLAEFISASSNNIDMDGALFIPFNGIDLSGDISVVTVFFEWDIEGAFDDADNDGNYEMDNRYNGTCFNFDVRVETESVNPEQPE
ncbi:MAG TPA: hypothetical protein DCO79_08885 [Spirochaeta sp.]|nr:hypothetical protein [Spirochaeta sp.]